MEDDGFCFVCGPDNPAGLRLRFTRLPGDEGCETTVTFADTYQGWPGVVHGGLLSTLLDEAMVKAATHRSGTCVTAEITVKFKHTARTGTPYRVRGHVISTRHRLVFTEGWIEDLQGNHIASATAKFFALDRLPEQRS